MDALDRLYRRVADVLLRQPDAQVTVGDVYQNLVPYRLVRNELGFSELAEYEYALLRLLAGERDYVIVERPEVQEELQRELRATNPILGIYRDYSGVGVYLNPYAPEIATVVAPPPVPAERPAPAGPDATVAETPPAPVRRAACPVCRTPLPGDRAVRFCPHCGKPLVPVPCAECSAMIEPEWKFCATCGWPREPGGRTVQPSPEQRLR
jgi:hypothetical protein